MKNDENKIEPVFIALFFSNKNPINVAIKLHTKENFAHACIGFDSSLDKLFSYNAFNNINIGGGFSIENLNRHTSDPNTKLRVNVLFLKKKYVNQMKNYIDNYIKNIKNTRYNLNHIVNMLLNKKDEDINSYNQICSEFISNVFKSIGIELVEKSTNLITPGNLENIKKVKSYLMFDGITSEYKKEIVDKKINKIISRVKSIKENFDLELDNEFDYKTNKDNYNQEICDLLDNYNNSDIFLSSDWHLFRQNKENLKYKINEENISEFINNQSKLLTNDKVFIYLGDLGHRDNTPEQKETIKKIISNIPATKILVKGNHDSENDQYYKDCGFKFITNELIYNRILFTHKPVSIKDNKDIDLNIHGHIHESKTYYSSEPENHINVFEEQRKPMNLSYILSHIKELTKDNVSLIKIDTKKLYEILNKYKNYQCNSLNNYERILSYKEFNQFKSGSHFDFSNAIFKDVLKVYPDSDLVNVYLEFYCNNKIIKTHSFTLIPKDSNTSYYIESLIKNKIGIYEGNMMEMIGRISVEIMQSLPDSKNFNITISNYTYTPDKSYEKLSIEDFIKKIKDNSQSQNLNYKRYSNLELKKVNESLNENYILNESSSNSKRKKIESLIYGTFSKLDKTGANTKKYKELFGKMSDKEFDNYMKNFLKDPKKNFYLEIVPNKIDPKLEDIKEALEFLKVPAEEYVYYRNDGDKDNPIRTRYKVPVGYLNIKRTQQLLSKKNTYSLDINSRSLKTNQVTGHDKVARISDLENYCLSSIGADEALKEFLGPRADGNDAKMEMYKNISTYGYTYLKDLPNDISKKQTINTIYQFLIGSGLESDLLEPPDNIENDLNNVKKQLDK